MSKLHISKDLLFPKDAVTQTIVVYGGKGMGKTNLGAVMAEELAAAHLRFAAIDPMGNWHGLRHSADGKGDGLEVLILGGRHGDLPIEPAAGAVVADLVADESVNVIIDISRRGDGKMWSKGERIRFVADYCTRLYERQGEAMRPLMQIIDEAARYCPQLIPHGSPDLARCVGAIEQLVEEGRNVGVGIMLLTQRSARLNKSVAELAECMIAFRTIGPNSVEAILDWLGEHVPKSSWKEKVEALRKLPRGTALVISPGWLEYEGLAAIRHRHTFDTSATPTAGKERRASGRGARPDLGKYQERMAATIEKAKAEDPKALRARVSQLEAENRKLASAKPAAAAVPKPVELVKPATMKAMERAIDRLDAAIARNNGMVVNLRGHVEVAQARGGELAKMHVELTQALQTLRAGPSRLTTVVADLSGGRPAASTVRNTNAPVRRTNRPGTGPGVGIPRGERAILTAAAQHDGGVTREQLTVLTGYKRSSRDTYVQRLRERGLLEAQGEQLVATQAGVDALGSGFEPLPTGDALLQHWLRELPEGERRVLEVIVRAYPKAVDREAISEATDYKRSSRDTYLQRLGARRLVIAERDGVRASEELFG